MEGHSAVTGFEMAVVVPKKREKERDDTADCVEFLVRELKRAGLIVERVFGISDEFIKVGFLLLFPSFFSCNCAPSPWVPFGFQIFLSTLGFL